MNRFRLRFLAFVAVSALFAAVQPAQAVQVTAGSELDFNGSLTPIGSPNSYTSTGSDFNTNGVASLGINGSVNINNTSSGAFLSFNAFTCPSAATGGCGTINDLTSYNIATSQLFSPPLPIANFLNFIQGANTLHFTLTSFSAAAVQPTGNNLGTLTLAGAGTLSFNSFDPTPAIFTITTQGPGATSYSGSILVAPVGVPEPTSMLLLATGLVSAGLLRRRTRRA